MKVARVAVRRHHTGDRAADEVQRLGQQIAQRFGVSPTSDSRLLDTEDGAAAGSGLSFTAATARSLVHGLGRKARGFLEVYGPDVVSAAAVNLRPTAHPAGITSDTHITVTPASTGTCFVLVF